MSHPPHSPSPFRFASHLSRFPTHPFDGRAWSPTSTPPFQSHTLTHTFPPGPSLTPLPDPNTASCTTCLKVCALPTHMLTCIHSSTLYKWYIRRKNPFCSCNWIGSALFYCRRCNDCQCRCLIEMSSSETHSPRTEAGWVTWVAHFIASLHASGWCYLGKYMWPGRCVTRFSWSVSAISCSLCGMMCGFKLDVDD